MTRREAHIVAAMGISDGTRARQGPQGPRGRRSPAAERLAHDREKPLDEDCLLESTPPSECRSAVRPVVHRFLKRFKLSKRETEAIVLLTGGLCAKEIAERMACSEKTVYAHVSRVCKKTGSRDYHAFVCKLLAFACNAR